MHLALDAGVYTYTKHLYTIRTWQYHTIQTNNINLLNSKVLREFYFIEKENDKLSKHDVVSQIIVYYWYKGWYILLYRLNWLEFKM